MKINKYWKPKRKYDRKRKYNRTHKGSLTKRQKNINENGAIIAIAVVGILAITYAFMMTSNNITIDGSVAEIESPIQSKLERLCVEPQSDGENFGPPTISPSDVVVREVTAYNAGEKGIREIAKEHNFKWTDYLVRLAKCESSLNPKVINDNGIHGIDRGIFQINNRYHWEVSDECAFDIRCATIWTMGRINNGYQYEWVCDKKIKS